ncbi:MAG: cell division protein ZapA [Desulfobacterales bacterium]
MERHVTIQLFGQSYTFKAESEGTNAQAVADYLVEQVKEVDAQLGGQQSGASKLNTMILAAMNIANENVTLKREQSILLKEVSDRSANLIKRIDRYPFQPTDVST